MNSIGPSPLRPPGGGATTTRRLLGAVDTAGEVDGTYVVTSKTVPKMLSLTKSAMDADEGREVEPPPSPRQAAFSPSFSSLFVLGCAV